MIVTNYNWYILWDWYIQILKIVSKYLGMFSDTDESKFFMVVSDYIRYILWDWCKYILEIHIDSWTKV